MYVCRYIERERERDTRCDGCHLGGERARVVAWPADGSQ